MSTVPPDFPREVAARAAEAGYHALDACVLGNPMHARQGEMRVMAGGEEQDFRAVEPLLEVLGKEVTYLGESGMGATMKLVLNMLMGVQMPALAEAVVFGERAGLEREQVLEMIAKSGYSSPVMSFRCAIMGQRNFEFAAFKLGLMRKDMTLVLGEAQKAGVPMPVTESAHAMLTAAQQQGLGDLDVAAMLAFQERMSGVHEYPWPGADQPRTVEPRRDRRRSGSRLRDRRRSGEPRRDRRGSWSRVVIVDVHGHITHPELFKRYPMPPALADIEGMLDRKSEAGIGVTIVGSPVGFGTMSKRGHDNYAQSADELKSFHEWLAETVRKHAPRLAAYAYTNPFGDSALLEQTAQTVRDGGFVGLIVNTSVGGEYLDSPRADEFFAMAAELGKPVFLHPPAEPVGSDSIEDFRLVEQVGRFMDVTVGLATLVFAGRLEQHPDLELIAATAGGAISLLAGRMDSGLPAAPLGRGWPPRRWASGGSGGPPGGPPAVALRRWPPSGGAPEVAPGGGPGAGGLRSPADGAVHQQDHPASEHLSAARVRRHRQLQRAQPARQPGVDGCRSHAVRHRLAAARDAAAGRDRDGRRTADLGRREAGHPGGQRAAAVRAVTNSNRIPLCPS